MSIDEKDPVAIVQSVRSALRVPQGQSLVAYAVWASLVVDWACKTYNHLDGLIEDHNSFEFGVVEQIMKDFPQ